MASKPASSCRKPGCPGLVRNGTCSVCGKAERLKGGLSQTEYDQRRGSAAARGYDHRWRELRKMFLRAHPLCVECDAEGRVVVATDVDHIKPKSEGGTDDFDNLQPLCHSHHSRKTFREAMSPKGQAMSVTIVTGPPGAGKTTLVKERAHWGDLIVDVDAIYSALSGLSWYEKPDTLLPFVLEARNAVLNRIAKGSDVRHAWIITSEADVNELLKMKAKYNGKLIVLQVKAHECIQRINSDERRSHKSGWDEIVNQWWETYSRTRHLLDDRG